MFDPSSEPGAVPVWKAYRRQRPAAAGIGIAAMPESFIRPISKGKKVVMLSLLGGVATLQTYVVSCQHTASPLVNDFFDHCREIRDR